MGNLMMCSANNWCSFQEEQIKIYFYPHMFHTLLYDSMHGFKQDLAQQGKMVITLSAKTQVRDSNNVHTFEYYLPTIWLIFATKLSFRNSR